MFKTAYSNQPDALTAVADIKSALAGEKPALVLFFASTAYDPSVLAAAMRDAFPGARTMGCTTAGELVDNQMTKNSLVAMSCDAGAVKAVAVEFAELGEGVTQAADRLGRAFGSTLLDLDPKRHVGLILLDGMSGAEEKTLDALANVSNIPFVGGSAGDDLKFAATKVFLDGQARSGAAVLALLEPSVPFAILKTQSFTATDKTLAATKVDEAKRLVLEFNGKPAAEAYAEAVGVSPAQAADNFMAHPIGLMIDEDEPYVRSPQRLENGGMYFYCAVKKDMTTHILDSGDIVGDTKRALEAHAADGGIAAVINFNCILRTLELEKEGRTADYGQIFQWPTIGFSTYGEAYLGHINQTSTMLIFQPA